MSCCHETPSATCSTSSSAKSFFCTFASNTGYLSQAQSPQRHQLQSFNKLFTYKITVWLSVYQTGQKRKHQKTSNYDANLSRGQLQKPSPDWLQELFCLPTHLQLQLLIQLFLCHPLLLHFSPENECSSCSVGQSPTLQDSKFIEPSQVQLCFYPSG